MEHETIPAEEEAHLSEMEGGDGDKSGRAARLARFLKVQLYLPLKDVISLEEIRLKRMKQGNDVSRSRLVSEAIKLLSKDGGEPKNEVRG